MVDYSLLVASVALENYATLLSCLTKIEWSDSPPPSHQVDGNIRIDYEQ